MARELFENSPEVSIESSSRPAAVTQAYSEPQNSAPSFGAFLTEDVSEEEPKSKKPYFIVAAIVIAAGMAFYGWTAKHESQATAPSPATSAAPQPDIAAPATVPAESAPAAAVSVPSQNSSTRTVDSATSDHRGAMPGSAKNSTSAKNELIAEDTVTKIAPLVVKSSSVPMQTASNEPAPQAPGLNITSSSTDQNALSSLVASTPVTVPKHSQQTLRVSQGVSQGLILKRVQPVYPSSALQMRIQGSVQLLATISKEGSISNLTVLSGEGVLSRAASDAVRQWKYKPYYLNGEPVEIQTQITVNFKLPN
jgi:TonB family protein